MARFYLEIPADLGEPQILRHGSRSCRNCWLLAWQYPTVSGQQLYAAAVDDATGHVVQYYSSQAEANLSRSVVQLSRADAWLRAEAVIDRLAHRFRAELQTAGPGPLARPGPMTGDYTFAWDRMAWGIPIAGEGATVVISGRTGGLLSYRLKRSGNPPARPQRPLLSQAEATAHYRQILWPQLWYRRLEPWPEPARWQPVYQRPPNAGDYPNVSAERLPLAAGEGTTVAPPPMSWVSLPSLSQPFRAPAAPVNRAATLAVARRLTGRDDPPDVAEITRGSSPNPQQGFTFTWPVPSPSAQARFSTTVSIDAKTGLVHRFQDDAPMFGPQAPFIDGLEAERRAVEFLTAFRPDLVPQVAYQRTPAPTRPGWQARFYGPAYPSRGFSFQYLRDGIPVDGVQARVDVHAVSGAILRFEFDDHRLRQPAEWQPAPAVISRETAFDRLLAAAPLTLAWDPAGPLGPYPRWQPRLGPGAHFVDARTGHLLDERGFDLTALGREPADVTAHPYREEILGMVARGVLSAPEGRFRPEGSLSRSLAVRWLLTAAKVPQRGRYVRYAFPEAAEMPEALSYWVQAAIDAGVVTLGPGEPFRPDAPVTRAEFALWTARLLGYGALTTAEVAMTPPSAAAADLPAAQRNALAMLAGLGVLSANVADPTAPEGPLTRGEAAFVLHWVLTQTGGTADTTRPLPIRPPSDPSAPQTAAGPEPAISREEAVRIARDLFAIPPELGEPTVSSYKTEAWHIFGARVPVWRIDWRYKVDDPLSEGKYAVQIRGDTGDVMSFSRNFGRDRSEGIPPPGLPRLTRSQARARAEAELQRLTRRYSDQLQPEPEPTLDPPPALAHSHTFRWERTAHGLAHDTDGARVVIDAFSGELSEFSLIWNPQPIPAPGPYLAAQEATAGFRDAVRLEPVYRRFNAPEGPRWRVVYRPLLDKYPAVDAHSGALLDEHGQTLDIAGRNRRAALPQPDVAYTPPAAPLNRSQSLAVARALGDSPDPVEVHEIPHGSGPNPDPGFRFVWPGADVTVNARVGRIDQYEYKGPFPAFSAAPAVDRLAAAEQAIRFLVAHRPDLAPNLRLVSSPAAPVRVSYGERGPLPQHLVWRGVFQMLRDGIAVQGAQIEVDVLAATGAVSAFRIRDGAIQNGEREGAVWQPPPTTVDPQWAMDRLLAQAPLTLGWHRLPGPAQAPVLQWRVPVSDYDSIDALTGRLVNYDGRDRLTRAEMPVDVADHPDRDAMATLVTHGFMSALNGRFRPDGTIARAEAARLIAQMRNSRLPGQPARFSFPEAADLPAPIAAWIQAAYDAGYVTLPPGAPFRPDAPVTRAEFALWVTRALGYGALLNADVEMALPFADAAGLPPALPRVDAAALPAAPRNAVAILAGLSALELRVDRSFQPDAPLTRGEAARLLYLLGTQVRRW